MHWIGRITKFILFALLFVFALQNTAPIRLQVLYLWEWQAPLVLVLLVFFVAGAVLGLLALAPQVWRWRKLAKAAHSKTDQPGLAAAGLDANLDSTSTPSNPSTVGKHNHGV